jgi:hypothetical protein
MERRRRRRCLRPFRRLWTSRPLVIQVYWYWENFSGKRVYSGVTQSTR